LLSQAPRHHFPRIDSNIVTVQESLTNKKPHIGTRETLTPLARENLISKGFYSVSSSCICYGKHRRSAEKLYKAQWEA
jgi:hypothetical protein